MFDIYYEKNILFIVCILFTLVTSCKTTNQLPPEITPIKPLSERVHEVINTYDPHAKIGIQIVDLQKKSVVYELNPSHLFIPSSVLKLYTAGAALYYLGPSYRFETQIFADGLKKNQIDNLYIRASGDPSFSSNEMIKIVNVLKQFGIKTIQKNIVIDDSQFDNVLWGNGWMWNDMINGYSAPISALSLDFNRIAVFAWPGENPGDPVYVTVEPYTNFLEIKNLAQTAAENSRDSLRFHLNPPDQTIKMEALRGVKQKQTIYISGFLPKQKAYRYETFSVENPTLFAGYFLQEELKKNNIIVKGQIEEKTIAQNARLIDTISSRPLSEALIDFVKFSNNQATETLLKTIGLKYGEAPGTFEKGIKAVQRFLSKEAKLRTVGLVNADGSGLSRYSLTSPRQMTDFLNYMWHSFPLGPEFIATLPIAGKDGTLNNGWKNSELKGRVRAKTGSMTSLYSLAGYLDGNAHETYAFSVFINGTMLNGLQSQQLIEKILLEVLKT